jgi:hypothetical protein
MQFLEQLLVARLGGVQARGTVNHRLAIVSAGRPDWGACRAADAPGPGSSFDLSDERQLAKREIVSRRLL